MTAFWDTAAVCTSETSVYFIETTRRTERRGRVANTPASYSVGPGSNLRPDTAIPIEFSWFSSVTPDECRDSAEEINPRSVLSNSFPIQHSFTYHTFI
jgi:hypothetical protein